jgi:putative MATE family efflux protein
MKQERRMSLWMLAWPVFLEMFLQFLLGTADTLMVSHISDDAVAVIGISSQLFNAVNILFMAIASGAGILIAQKLGAKRVEEARLLSIIGSKVSIAIGALLSVLLYFGALPIAKLLQIPPALLPLAETYISIVGGGMVFMAAMAVFGTAIRNTGDTRTPMYIALGMNIIHIVLNYVVIYGAFGFPVLGMTGVAWSTTISRIIGAVAMYAVYRHSFQPGIVWRDWRLFDRPLFRETLKLSWPLGVNMSSWCFTQLVIFALIAMLGPKELSARTYMNTMESFCFLIGYSMALAGQIRIAHLFGSGNKEHAYRTAYQVLWIGLALVMVNAFVLYMFGEEAIQFFTKDAEIVALGVSLLAINLVLQPVKMLNMAIVNALTAVGDTRYTMVVGFSSMWAIAVGLSYYVSIPLGWGLFGIYAGMILDELVRGVLVLARWRGKKYLHGKQQTAVAASSAATIA